MAEKKPLAKVVEFELLGALFGPGAPDPDLGRFRIRVKHGILNISLDVRKKANIGTHGQSMPRWIRVRRHVSRTYFITKVAIRVRERSRFFETVETPRVLEQHSCDTCTRTEPILQT